MSINSIQNRLWLILGQLNLSIVQFLGFAFLFFSMTRGPKLITLVINHFVLVSIVSVYYQPRAASDQRVGPWVQTCHLCMWSDCLVDTLPRQDKQFSRSWVTKNAHCPLSYLQADFTDRVEITLLDTHGRKQRSMNSAGKAQT